MNQEPPGRPRRWLALAVEALIVAVLLWFVRRTIADAWQQLGTHQWRFHAWWLSAAGALYLLGMLPCGVFWHRTLLALGQPASLRQSLWAYYIGTLGKYVPGKAMVVVLRAGLVRGQGVDASLAAVSVFFETLTMMSTGALLAAAIVAVWYHQQMLLFWAAIGMAAAALTPTLPPVFKRLVRLVGVGRRDPVIAEKLGNMGYGTMLVGWLLTGLGWAILGLSFWAVARSMGAGAANPLQQLHLYTAGVSLATVAGFVSFIPGGVVVREAVLTQLMAPYLGDAVALVGVLLWRLVQVVSELVISCILYLGTHALRRHTRLR
jgi:glycosyltransferase 2 family protein